MRRLLQFGCLLAMFAGVATLHPQTTPLPPGTTAPGQTSPPAEPGSRAAQSIAQAEDAIVRGDYGKALPLLDQAIAQTAPRSQQAARALYDRGYVEQAQHQLDRAQADFRQASVADPKQFESHVALGSLLAQQGKWKPAQQELEQAATLQPAGGDRAQLLAANFRMLARVDAQQHEDSAASDALLAALRLTPEQNDDTILAAQLAEDEGNFAGAEQEYKKALARDPLSVTIAERLARVFNHEDKYSEAETLLQQMLPQEPNDPVLLAESATALDGMGKTQDAITQLEALHRQNPNQPAVTRMLADLYSGGGQPANAEPLYQQLLAASPESPDLLTAAAENLVREQKGPQAIEMFQQSLTLQPQQPEAWGGLAFAASQNQDYALVLTALDRRAQFLPESAATLFLRATALDHLHHTQAAVTYYRRFLSESLGKFPDEESQTRRRLTEIQRSH